MGSRETILSRKIGVNRFEYLCIVGGGRSGGDVDNEVGCLVVAGLGQVDLVPQPTGGALGAVARSKVVWRLDQFSGRRKRLLWSPGYATG